MVIGPILISAFLMFIIIFFAVRLAINPLLYKSDEADAEGQDNGLIKLYNIEVLSKNELDEIIELYQKKGIEKQKYEQYQKYERILVELKEMDYLSGDEYIRKMDKLKNYYGVN